MYKKNILISIRTYLPGYKGGGPTKSIKNLIEGLKNKFNIYLLTDNHDLGNSMPYKKVKSDEWNVIEGVSIFYTSEKYKKKNINSILKNKKFDVILLNSFFSTDTIKILYYIRRLNIKSKIVLMPRGELSQGALNFKKNKKMFYINLVKKFKKIGEITYLVTADDEFEQVKKLLNSQNIYKVDNIPDTEKILKLDTKEENLLKIVFLSRIVEKKNLDFALKTFENCTENIHFNIYGTIEDDNYWAYCKGIIKSLPSNIEVSYKGEIINQDVVKTLSSYDLFYFPTKSENYGHVISEALQASIPVLISDQTPWKNLNKQKFGWELPLDNISQFKRKIKEYSELDVHNFNSIKQHIFDNYDVSKNIEEKYNEYIKVFST